jgi:hypothetical protein
MSDDKDKDKPSKAFKNVVLFPENRIKRPVRPVSPAATKKMRDYQAAKFVETATDEIGLDLVRRFVLMGLDTKQDVFTKDLAMAMDAIRGLLYRQFKMVHPIQKVTDGAVKLRMNKAGVVTARIEYGNISDETSARTKPITKNISDDLNNRNSGYFQFTEDFEFKPEFDSDGNPPFPVGPDDEGPDKDK